MQTMVPKSWRLCPIRPSACCAVLAFLPLRLVCATTVVIPKLFSTSYPSLLGRTHKPCDWVYELVVGKRPAIRVNGLARSHEKDCSYALTPLACLQLIHTPDDLCCCPVI